MIKRVLHVVRNGALDLVGTLRDHRFVVGNVTTGNGTFQKSKLENNGLIDQVYAFVISGEFGVRKPEKAIYDEMARRPDIDPRKSWFVGDGDYR